VLSSTHEGDSFQTFKVKEMLEKWGLQMNAAEIPLLCLPEPLSALICTGNWSTLLLRSSWHKMLVDQWGSSNFVDKPLFINLAWPPSSSLVWPIGAGKRVEHAEIPDMSYSSLTVEECN
jgi:hypothetical protein